MSGPVRGVIGTAGHVDHGKTSLVRALTGVDGDRLPEEKRRGITIDLGFAAWRAPGLDASIVDVPGHERFVHTMVAGAAGIDAVILVVAADDGVMPQTREHLAICTLLGVRAGVVAVTKRDLVDDEMLALGLADVEEAVRGTFLERAARVAVSVRDGRGLEALTEAVRDVLRVTPPHAPHAPAWMSIDRAFSKHGHGTVVTGTLVRGTIARGGELELVSARGARRVTARSLAIHGGEVERALAATRLAVGLRDVDVASVPRGAVLAAIGAAVPTRSLDVAVRWLEDRESAPRGDLVLHAGAAHVTARARVLSRASAEGVRRVRFTCEAPIVVAAGDRVVIRRPERARDRTIGGGEVIDPHPALARPERSPDPWVAPSLEERVRAMVAELAAGATRSTLLARLPPGTEIAPILEGLERAGAIVRGAGAGEVRFHAASELSRAQREVLTALAAHHAAHPASPGATTHELAAAVPAPWRPLVALAVGALVREGAIRGGDRVALLGHDASALAARVLALHTRVGLAVPSEEAIVAELALPARSYHEAVRALAEDGALVRVQTGLHVARSALDALVAAVATFFDTHDALGPADFKALTGLTRKNAIALLEWLDREGVTRREGEQRVRGAAPKRP